MLAISHDRLTMREAGDEPLLDACFQTVIGAVEYVPILDRPLTAAFERLERPEWVEVGPRTLPKPVMPQLVTNRDFAHNWMRRNWSFHFAAV
jgi:hypothetical protein